MDEFFNWDIAIKASESRHSKRIACKQFSPQSTRVRVDFRCETVQKWMHYGDVGHYQRIHREPKMKTRTTFFDYALPAEDLKKLMLKKLEFFDLRSDYPNRKGKLAEEVICEARILIDEGKERSSSLVVNIEKTMFFYLERNRVPQEISSDSEDDGGDHESESRTVCSVSSDSDDDGGDDESESCTLCLVCLEDTANGDKVTTTLPCSHVFHTNCIVELFKEICYCPECRFEITEPKRRRIY